LASNDANIANQNVTLGERNLIPVHPAQKLLIYDGNVQGRLPIVQPPFVALFE
jgi:hypothetical protein